MVYLLSCLRFDEVRILELNDLQFKETEGARNTKKETRVVDEERERRVVDKQRKKDRDGGGRPREK